MFSSKNISSQVKSNKYFSAIEALPVSLPAAVTVFGVFIMALLLFGQLHTFLVLVFGVPLFISTLVFVSRKHANNPHPGGANDKVTITLLVLLFIFMWTGFNMYFTSQNIHIYRDPAIYTMNGAYLIDSPNLEFTESQVFGDDEDILGSGISLHGMRNDESSRLFVHGGQLLPAFLGLLGRVGGEAFMMGMSSVFGGLAVLSVYGLTKLFVPPRWALYAPALLSVSLPLIYFSRDTYTEPLTLAVVFSALSLIYIAQQNLSRLLWLIAGLAAGAITLVRIDGYMVIAAFLLFIFFWLALSAKKDRKEKLSSGSYFLLGLTAAAVLGWVLYTTLGAKYYHDLNDKFLLQIMLLVGVAVGGLGVLIVSWKTKIFKVLERVTHNWRGIAIVLLILGVTVALASRPFWYIDYAPNQNSLVASLQESEGNTVEPRRYSEQSLNWIWWYLGPVASLLGLYGFIAMGHDLVTNTRKRIKYLPFLLVFGVVASVYLVRPAISPDQIWAVRRFLPIVLPGIGILAAVGLYDLHNRFSFKYKSILTAFIIIASLASPLFISWPFLDKPIYQDQLEQVNIVCEELPDDAAVLLAGRFSFNMIQATKTFCDVPAERIKKPEKSEIKEAALAAREAGYTPILHVEDSSMDSLPQGYRLTKVTEWGYDEPERSLYRPPRSTISIRKAIYLGVIDEEGNVNPL